MNQRIKIKGLCCHESVAFRLNDYAIIESRINNSYKVWKLRLEDNEYFLAQLIEWTTTRNKKTLNKLIDNCRQFELRSKRRLSRCY